MPLENLVTRAPAQKLKIDELIGYGERFSNSERHYLSIWAAFRNSLWGKDLPIVKAQEPVKGDAKVLPDDEGLYDGKRLSDSDEPLTEAASVPRLVVEIPEVIAHIWNLENPKFLVRSEYEEAKQANIDNIQAFMVTGQPGIGSPSLTLSSTEPKLLSGEPSPASRSDCEKRVTSRSVLELLWDQHLQGQVSELKYFYNLFRSSPISASAAGWVFELWMHQSLRQGGSIQLFHIGRRSSKLKSNSFCGDHTASEQGENQKVLQLTTSEDHPPKNL